MNHTRKGTYKGSNLHGARFGYRHKRASLRNKDKVYSMPYAKRRWDSFKAGSGTAGSGTAGSGTAGSGTERSVSTVFALMLN